MPAVIRPHGGGSLTNNFVDISKIDNDLFTLDVKIGLKKDIENISFGVFSPLKGFLNEQDFHSVVNKGRLANDLPWTIPIVLDADDELAKKTKDSSQVALRSSNNDQIFGVMDVEDVYSFDKKTCAKSVFQTDDPLHPGFQKFVTMKNKLIGGKVRVVGSNSGSSSSADKSLEGKFRLTPSESRKMIQDQGWESTVAFQTRNVPHVAHEMLQKAALNIFDGLFINPLIGKKKKGDFKDDVILNSYIVLIDNYYPKSRIIFSTLHTEMKYAGPREAIHHAIMRQNFGCSHIIIGRDHAGVGNYYFCKKCQGYVNERTCPHESEFREELSGTKMRKMFSSGELPPSHLMRPEISKVILTYPEPFVE